MHRPEHTPPRKSIWRKSFAWLIYFFPGATLFFTLFSRSAFHTAPDASYSATFSTLSAYIFYFCFYTIMQRLPNAIAVVFSPLASFMFCMLIFVHRMTGRMIPVYYLMDNLSEVWSTAMYSGLGFLVLGLLALYLVWLGLFLFLRKRMARFRREYNLHYWPVRIATAVSFIAVVSGLLAPNHLQYFFRSGVSAYLLNRRLKSYEIQKNSNLVSLYGQAEPSRPDYPYVRKIAGQTGAGRSVFLILLESQSGLYPQAMPFLDKLGRDNISAERFYSVSINTPRGHLSTLCGVYPSFLQKGTVEYADNNFNCLPSVLNHSGYATYAFIDIPWLQFDNMYAFFKNIGFEQIHNFVSEQEEQKEDVWSSKGDAAYYKDVFGFLEKAGNPHPALVAIGTNGTHWPFGDESRSYKTPGLKMSEYNAVYRKALRKADEALRLFFEKLADSPYRDALVVIAGDHPFPAGEHNNIWNENGSYEESFRSAFAIKGAGQRRHRLASQVDVMPTILSALKIPAETHLAGVSLLSEIPRRLIQYSQPYDGKHLCSLEWPFKRCFEVERNEARIYNLEQDPLEQKTLAESEIPPERLARLKQGQELWYLNQALFIQNRFYPARE